MTQVFWVALGGAAGSVARFLSSQWIHALAGRGFPYGTLFVNVSGSLVMGFLYALLVDRMALGPEWRALLMVGFLGGFTTFSAFSMETVNLLAAHEFAKAAANIALSLVLCLGGAWLGLLLGRQL
jgi:CrcB protein